MEQAAQSGRRVAFFGGSFDPPHLGHLAIARAARKALLLDRILFAPVGAQPLKPSGSTASFADRAAMTELAIRGEAGFELSLIDAPKLALRLGGAANDTAPSDTAPNDIAPNYTAPNYTAPNYTIDALLTLRAEMPADEVLFCLMGADSFLGLRRWHRGAEIPFVAQLIVAARPGQPLDDLRMALPEGLFLDDQCGHERAVAARGDHPEGGPAEPADGSGVRSCILRNMQGESTRLYLLPSLHVEISASAVRESIRGLLGSRSSQQMAFQGQRLELVPAAVLDYIAEHELYR